MNATCHKDGFIASGAVLAAGVVWLMHATGVLYWGSQGCEVTRPRARTTCWQRIRGGAKAQPGTRVLVHPRPESRTQADCRVEANSWPQLADEIRW